MTIHELWKYVESCTFLLILYTHIVIPYITDGPGSSVSFNLTDESITKILGEKLGPIVCSAQCNPQCQFYWIKPDGTVVNESTLEIQNLSKNDHGTFTCHAGNGYGKNATKNLPLIVICKYLMLNTILLLAKNDNIIRWIDWNVPDYHSLPRIFPLDDKVAIQWLMSLNLFPSEDIFDRLCIMLPMAWTLWNHLENLIYVWHVSFVGIYYK